MPDHPAARVERVRARGGVTPELKDARHTGLGCAGSRRIRAQESETWRSSVDGAATTEGPPTERSAMSSADPAPEAGDPPSFVRPELLQPQMGNAKVLTAARDGARRVVGLSSDLERAGAWRIRPVPIWRPQETACTIHA